MSSLIIERGLKLFNLHIGSDDLQRETFIEVAQCFKCFRLDDHNTQECTKPGDYSICSKCSSSEHLFQNCNATKPCCINCKLPHPSTSFSCPERKKVVEAKRKTKNRSYSDILKKETEFSTSALVLDKNLIMDKFITSLLCITVASKKEEESPGSFSDTLAYLQTRNNVPNFCLGDIKLTDSNFRSTYDSGTNQNHELEMTNRNSYPASVYVTSAPQSRSPLVKLGNPPGDVGGASGREEPMAPAEAVSKSDDQCVEDAAGVRVRSNVTCSAEHSVKIFKKDGTVKLYPSNIESLYNKGKIGFSCDTLNEYKCLEYLKSNLLDCKLAIARAVVNPATSTKTRSKTSNKNNG